MWERHNSIGNALVWCCCTNQLNCNWLSGGTWWCVGPVSVSDKMSHHKISWNIEAARLEVTITVSLRIWQVSQKQCCGDACQISEWFDYDESAIPWMLLTHLLLDKMAAIRQTTFSWMKNFNFWLKYHWSLFLRVQLTIGQHWFR